MNKKMWMKLMVAMLVLGLFMTVSCAKKTILSDGTTIEDQEKAKALAEQERIAAQERIKSQELQDQMAKAKESKIVTAQTRFVNEDILFVFDSFQLSPAAKSLLKEKADWLRENSKYSVTIEGHCDENGTTEYNIALGERRALAVKKYLKNLGIAGYRLTTVSFGEEKPLDTGNTEAAYQKNRRAHFVL